ncbi:MAG: Nramp family divalent metal transporter [Bryobacteraceae bacterium]|nr:Nramp family divalent metal transporter [Bryobacteraceae bacterium]
MDLKNPVTGQAASLPEVNASVPTSQLSLWKRLFAFAGPAYLVSVGYMDPGNWATDLEGGASFGYDLLWVLLLSNLMAILLQTLSARLGIVTRRDLAQACRDSYPKPVAQALWVLCEVAIAACDLAEVLGAAIALNLLFGLPLIWGVALTALDTLLILWFTRFGIRVVEAFILALVVIIGVCFLIEIVWAQPPIAALAGGLVPRLTDKSLYVAIGILGATVMPHNLYLHSALVQTRQIGETVDAKRTACRFNFFDSVVALNGALLVNASILILAASVFHERGIEVKEIQQAHQLLSPLLGATAASALFAIALLCAGQSSTLTGTLAGQIVMEGFLNFRMRPWLRRLITRAVAIIPAAATILIAGEQATYKLLILSQVVLSLQLPFAVIPLIQFTSDKGKMGSFANKVWVKVLAWAAAVIIVSLNLRLAWTTIAGWLETSGEWRTVVIGVVAPMAVGILALLLWVTFQPLLRKREARDEGGVRIPAAPEVMVPAAVYRKILVPLDHSTRDGAAVSHAVAMARQHGAEIVLLHVEEGVTSRVYGPMASTAEVEEGRKYFDQLLESIRNQGVKVDLVVTHSTDPRHEIVRIAKQMRPDLVVMGAHGHKGIQDLIFGATINGVRHELDSPLLIVKAEAGAEPG